MSFTADLHIHGSFSRGCSKNIDLKNLEKYAKIKGIDLLGTGDFTHPLWLKSLKEQLVEDNTGILKTKTGFPFVLQTEIALIFSQGGRGRRIHLCILAKNFDTVNQITEYLGKKGRLDYDGRPIFGISAVEFVESLKKIDDSIEIFPAHCLLPDEKVLCNPRPKKISEIEIGEKVLTHTGTYKKVTKTHTRPYDGKIYHIQPYYFSSGINVTSEHPLYAIKTVKDCSDVGGLCKPNNVSKWYHKCQKGHYKNYKPEWIKAQDLEVNDVLLYPIIKKTSNVNEIRISDITGKIGEFRLREGLIVPNKGRQDKAIPNTIKITPDFCRLMGYFLAEGYIIKRNNCVQFCFGQNESDYIEDVICIMKNSFGIVLTKKRERNGFELYFHSKVIADLFDNFFYETDKPRRAPYKKLPEWALYLPENKQAEIFKGWWRGDAGTSTSEILITQMKLLCLRLGIIPSINIQTKEAHNRKTSAIINGRKIISHNDTYTFHNLSFFRDEFNLLHDSSLKRFKTKLDRKHGWMDDDYIYIPIRKIETSEYAGNVYNLEVDEDNSYVTPAATVHNCWTPYFGVFGSMSGFDSLKECFLDKTHHIHAIETGMSSDPAMNWRLSQLDNVSIISNSDAHSFWPWRLGREANIFNTDMTYDAIIKALRTKTGLQSTLETDPGYGKYHFSGHEKCNVSLSPQDSKRLNDICPACHKKLTVGVAERVDFLADRPENYVPKDAVPYKTLIPLSELIAEVCHQGTATKKTWETYYKLLKFFGSEMNILLNVEESKLKTVVDEKLARIIILNREGKIKIIPGYDGVYGKPVIE